MSKPRRHLQRPPALVVILAALGVAYLVVPVLALGARVPFSRFGEVLTRSDTGELLRLTLSAAMLSSLIVVILGVPIALWMQSLPRGASLARLLVLVPLAMPPVVGGLALSALLGHRGLAAPLLDATGVHFAFAFPGVVASHVFVALPFVVVAVDAALRQVDQEVSASAASVGLSPGRILRHITLPTIAPAIATGAGLAFARSLGEFGTTITFAGSMPGVTRTISLAIYLERETDREAAYALAAILILLAVAALALAFLPTALRRPPRPHVRQLDEMDTTALRELTTADSPAALVYESAAARTSFPARSLTAIVGPNGSGKTTLVGTLAGRLRGGTVLVDGHDVSRLAAHQRGIVLLTQRPGLPPVATVAGALSMVTRDEDRTRALLDAAGLHQLAQVPVRALSGGQAAQVALLRALATRPRVLILDEPLAALDITSTQRWRALLRATAADRTTLLVTHDPLDVAGLSDRLVVVDDGRVIANGATGDVLAVPPSDFVAGLAGVNRIEGEVVAIEHDSITLTSGDDTIVGVSAGGKADVGERAVATIAPEAITLRLSDVDQPLESARNAWTGRITQVIASETVATTIVVDINSAFLQVPVTAASVRTLDLQIGTLVTATVKAQSVNIHPHPYGAQR